MNPERREYEQLIAREIAVLAVAEKGGIWMF